MHMFECVLDRAQDFVLTYSFSGSYFISMNRFAMDIPRNKLINANIISIYFKRRTSYL